MRQKLTVEEKAAAKALHQAEVLARREARKAETRARNDAKRAVARAQKIAQRTQAYEQLNAQRRDAFERGLSDADRTDLREALEQPSTKIVDGREYVTNEWLHSVKRQFATKGYLSQAQYEPLLRQVRRDRELAEKAKEWKELEIGETVKLWCTIVNVTPIRDGFGTSFKIRVRSHYGRAFSFSTTRQEWAELATVKKHEDKKVVVIGKVKWIAPSPGGPVVLTSRGMKFGDLL